MARVGIRVCGVVAALVIAIVLGNALLAGDEAYDRPLRPTTALIHVQESARTQAGYMDAGDFFEIVVRLPRFQGSVTVPRVEQKEVSCFFLYPESHWLKGGAGDHLILEIWLPEEQFEEKRSVTVEFGGAVYSCTMPEGHSRRRVRYSNVWHRVSPLAFWLTSRSDANEPVAVEFRTRQGPIGARYESGSLVSFPAEDGGFLVADAG